ARKNPNVKAILIRVNSPGGSAAASQEIYEELKKVEKPVNKPIKKHPPENIKNTKIQRKAMPTIFPVLHLAKINPFIQCLYFIQHTAEFSTALF
ncbi:unnamed protein product, partial [marine sediment metagenome]